MKREYLMHMLPLEVWMMIYQAAHALQYQRVIDDIKNRVLFIEVNQIDRTFIVCNAQNYWSPLLQIAVF